MLSDGGDDGDGGAGDDDGGQGQRSSLSLIETETKRVVRSKHSWYLEHRLFLLSVFRVDPAPLNLVAVFLSWESCFERS